MNPPDQVTTITYLEMFDPSALVPAPAPEGLSVSRVDPPSPEVNRRFYEAVGGDWKWTERLQWSQQQWREYVERPALETWLGRFEDQPAGYFELETAGDGSVQIAYFGLLPEFIGRGLGGALLTAAIRRAWEMPATRRLWLHTCTKDHPAALANYRRRGFEVFKTEQV